MFHDHSRRPCAVHYVFRPCSRLLFISISDKMATLHSLADLPVLVPFHGLVAMTRCDVDVSIIGQTATFHSSTDLPVSLPLYNLVVEASDDSMTRCGCGCLHHRPDGHLPLLHGPAGLIAVYGLAAAAQMLFTLRVYISVDVISIIDKTATLLSFMDLLVLSIVRSTS
jgi:hypothetical protein